MKNNAIIYLTNITPRLATYYYVLLINKYNLVNSFISLIELRPSFSSLVAHTSDAGSLVCEIRSEPPAPASTYVATECSVNIINYSTVKRNELKLFTTPDVCVLRVCMYY